MTLFGPMPSTEHLAGQTPEVPPMVTAFGVMDQPSGTPAALLARGKAQTGWHAGIAFIYSIYRGSPLRALIAVWVPAAQVRQRAGESYSDIPRINLTGPTSGWPALPAAHHNLPGEWRQLHQHASQPDPTGEFHDLRDAIRHHR